MSPEQIRSSASADGRSDIWSLGVVLYELLSGEQAFQAATVTEMCAAVLESEPLSLARICPDVPMDLVDVVAKAMEKDRTRRFADVAELAMALVPFAPSHARLAAERSSMRMRLAAAPESSGRFAASYTPTSWTPTSQLPHLEIVAAEEEAAPAFRARGQERRRAPWAAVLGGAGVDRRRRRGRVPTSGTAAASAPGSRRPRPSRSSRRSRTTPRGPRT